MKNKIKKPSFEALEELKEEFKEIYKRKPSNKIMDILTEEIASEDEEVTYDDFDIAASSIRSNNEEDSSQFAGA